LTEKAKPVSNGGTGQAAQETYWNQLVILKVVACYVRRYRDEQAWWINRIGLFKAVVTSGTNGAWAIWKDYAFLWGILIGAAQILDAAKDYIPQTRHRRSASEFVGLIESAIIDARFEWFAIFGGEYEATEIMNRWRALAKLLNETEGKYFPDGIPNSSTRQRLAEEEANAYFSNLYGVGGSEDD
jgi:hypothetical protein